MEKTAAVAALGTTSLLAPARARAALKANDRLKLGLSVLQAAAAHALSPESPPPDFEREIVGLGLGPGQDLGWLLELPGAAERLGGVLHLAGLSRLAAWLSEELATMARPLLDPSAAAAFAAPDAADAPKGAAAATDLAALQARTAHWQAHLAGLAEGDERLGADALTVLTQGQRAAGDSLHLLVMDLHKALNRLAATLATELVAGAHVWQLAQGDAGTLDRARIGAFMRGLARTRAAKLDHPGLDTAATRDGEVLMLQNDIGTNDAHVLVLEVRERDLRLHYSDLHRARFAFFQELLAALGAQWGVVGAQRGDGLNQGKAYSAGTAHFACADEAALQKVLEGVGASIVFLIDWNRARKRLLGFVDKAGAVAVLREAARLECGHMAWLAAGGERLIWQAMADQGGGAFHLGDRLDAVMGAEAARDLLVQVLVLAAQAAQRQQPVALVADETRLLLARALHGRRSELALLHEHAGLCHALAQGLRDALAHGLQRDAEAAQHFALRAKAWEREADHLVMRLRGQAERQPQWRPLLELIERSDDVADALEEAAFTLGLIADGGHGAWGERSREALQALADTVLGAAQDHVKALTVAQTFGESSDAADHDEFVAATWRVLQAERRCDELLRSARRALSQELREAAPLQLANELAAALEAASDALLALVYGLRARSFRRVEAL